MGGIFAIKGSNAGQRIHKNSKTLEHHGSDNECILIDNDIALGNRTLRARKNYVSHNLLSNEENTIWITFDGVLYNKEEIFTQFDNKHILNKIKSSAEIIIHMYEKYSYNCLNKFNGDFSFCICDLNKNILFSARDRLGVKSLYYYYNEDSFIIASEIKEILKDPLVPKIPNNSKIYEYLLSKQSKNLGDTFFMDIKELIPGHYMILKNNKLIINNYWVLNIKKIKDSKNNNVKYTKQFNDILLNSIKIRLPKNQKIGVMCSGGLDSVSISFMVNKILKYKEQQKNLELFSAIYDVPIEQDEKYFIDIVKKALNKKINYVYPSIDKIDDIKNFIYYIEEPISILSYYTFWCLCNKLNQKTKICLSGLGCDAILGGQNPQVMIYLKELWEHKKLYKLLNELFKSADWYLPWLFYSIFFKEKGKSKIKELINPKFIYKNNQEVREKDNSSLQISIYKDITEHANEYLRVCDKASSFFSVECRHPFLDYTLVEFSYSLPNDQRIKDGWTKYILRNAVKGLIPESIRKNRKKYGTPVPQQYWFNALRHDIKKIVNSEQFKNREYFNHSTVLDVFERYFKGKLNRIEREYYQAIIWRILNLELWFEIFF